MKFLNRIFHRRAVDFAKSGIVFEPEFSPTKSCDTPHKGI